MRQGRESSSSTVTVLKSTAVGAPNEMVILFTPCGLSPLKRTNANAALSKSSARREKHDVWGTNFTLEGDDGSCLFTSESIHLVARIEKVQTENVNIELT